MDLLCCSIFLRILNFDKKQSYGFYLSHIGKVKRLRSNQYADSLIILVN